MADQHPEVIDSLVAAWERAVGENQVFPLVEGSPLIWFQEPARNITRFTSELRLHPDVPSLESFRSARLIDGRSFRVSVDWDYRPGDQGVLFAHGGQESGYVCYLRDRHLRFFQNAFGRPLPVAPVPLAGASQAIEVVVAPGGARWLVSIAVDGEPVVSDVPFVAMSWLVPWNGDRHRSRPPFPRSTGTCGWTRAPSRSPGS